MPERTGARVTQVWPVDLKQRVQAVAGHRGVTEYTLAALEDRLAGHDRAAVLDQEVLQLRYLCQLLADRYVMGGTAADRETALMEVELPSWMDTTGWPEVLARQVQRPVLPPVPRKPPPEPINTEPTVRSEEPTVRDEAFPIGGNNDLLSRVQAKAQEKGVDITGAGLVPASRIETPRNHVEVAPPEETMTEKPAEPEPAPVAPPLEVPKVVDSYARCPDCGDPLVGEECWTCR